MLRIWTATTSALYRTAAVQAGPSCRPLMRLVLPPCTCRSYAVKSGNVRRSEEIRSVGAGQAGSLSSTIKTESGRSEGVSSTASTSPTVKADGPAPPAPSQPTTLLTSLKPYLALSRIDKPIGTYLLLWPCTWSLTLAAQHLSTPLPTLTWNLLLFSTGAFIMRGAGCTINDMWDARMDRLVARTRDRPLASGLITHYQAWKFLGLQLSLGLAVLLQLNWYSIFLGASSLAVVVIYPLMKRVTYWPQLVLGFAFNWGALLGWTAINAPPAWGVVLPLYMGSICWTILYDTIYAHQDKVDDVHAGVKSTALLFGDMTKPVLTAFSVGFLGLLTNAVAQVHPTETVMGFIHTHPVYSLALLPITAHLVWQIKTVDLASRPDCWRKFTSNAQLGLIIWIALMADYLWSYFSSTEDEQEQQTNTV